MANKEQDYESEVWQHKNVSNDSCHIGKESNTRFKEWIEFHSLSTGYKIQPLESGFNIFIFFCRTKVQNAQV